MKAHIPTPWVRLAVLLFVRASAGCTHTIHAPEGRRGDLSLRTDNWSPPGLCPVTPELRQARMEKSSGLGDTWLLPVGDCVAHNAETLARHLFTEVTVRGVYRRVRRPCRRGALTPKVVYVNRTMGSTSFGKSIVSVKTEWTLAEWAGNPLWVDTITGEAAVPPAGPIRRRSLPRPYATSSRNRTMASGRRPRAEWPTR